MAAVVECRTALAYSYVEGYYITNATKRELFNHIQSQLENYTDQLQELLEVRSRDVVASTDTGLAVVEYLRDVNNYTNVIKGYLGKICDAMRGDLLLAHAVGGSSSSTRD